MLRLILRDFQKEALKLRLRIKQFVACIQLLLCMHIADNKRKRLLNIEKKKYGIKAYDMNQNVMLMAVYNKQLKVHKQRLVIADNNQVIVLARKLRWLPKRMSAPIMQERGSVFYTTNPKMSKKTALKNYMKYVEAKHSMSE